MKLTTKDTKSTKGGKCMEFDELSNRVIGCAIEVHRVLGPGLLESTYEQCLAHDMKLAAIKTGLLINFNVTKLKDGIKRFVL